MSGILATLLPVLISLVGGYLARHYGVQIPGLPKAPASPQTSPIHQAAQGHVSRLQSILGLARGPAEALLLDILKKGADAAISQGLADLQQAGQPVQPVQK